MENNYDVLYYGTVPGVLPRALTLICPVCASDRLEIEKIEHGNDEGYGPFVDIRVKCRNHDGGFRMEVSTVRHAAKRWPEEATLRLSWQSKGGVRR